jgi:hypothetical protein
VSPARLLKRLGVGCSLLLVIVAFGTPVGAEARSNSTGRTSNLPRARASTLSGINVLASEFDSPVGLASGGGHLWVINAFDSVTELSATSDRLIRTITSPTRFDCPAAITSNGADVWVLNDAPISSQGGGSNPFVSEFSTSSGAPVGPTIQVGSSANPEAIAVAKAHVWILEDASLAEFSATSGVRQRVVHFGALNDLYEFSHPAMASNGSKLWVATGPHVVTEFSGSTGDRIATLSAPWYQFRTPDAITVSGADVWVSNRGGNSVTELSAATGRLVRVVSGSRFRFDWPSTLATDGTDVWVSNLMADSITELTNSGKFVQVMTGPKSGFYTQFTLSTGYPFALLPVNGDLVATNGPDDSITDISSAGAIVRVIGRSGYDFNDPSALADDGTHVWVANTPRNSVVELSATTGAFVQELSAPSYQFSDPIAIAADGSHVWVVNAAGDSVTELAASTGALVQVLSGSGFAFDELSSISTDGSHVWVASASGLTELSASTGALVQVLNGSNGVNGPIGFVVSDGSHVWAVQNGATISTEASVYELSASTGAVVNVLNSQTLGLADPDGIAADGTDLWISNVCEAPCFGPAVIGDVAEISAASGELVRTIDAFGTELFGVAADGTHTWALGVDGVYRLSAPGGTVEHDYYQAVYGFDGPSALTSAGSRVWVLNPYADSLTEFPAST